MNPISLILLRLFSFYCFVYTLNATVKTSLSFASLTHCFLLRKVIINNRSTIVRPMMDYQTGRPTSNFIFCTRMYFIFSSPNMAMVFAFNHLEFEFKGRVHWFSMQVVMNKCFLLQPWKNWRRSVLSFSRNTQKTHTSISKTDVTEQKARKLLVIL